MFNPYSGVKTSILILDKSLARRSDTIGFFKVENDGFDLGAQRGRIDQNDLPRVKSEIVDYLRRLRDGDGVEDHEFETGLVVDCERIEADGEFDLSEQRYRISGVNTTAYPLVALGDVCVLVRGVTYKKGHEVQEGGHKILRANNISKDRSVIDLSDIKLVTDSLTFDDSKRLSKNDIFICLASGSREHIGKVAFIPTDMDYFFGGFMGAIRAKEPLIDPRYLFYQLRHDKFNVFLKEQISGANINNLGAKLLYRYEIPMPSLDVQREIVSEIEGYQRVIDGARAVVENWRPRITVDPKWPVVELGTNGVFEVISGGTPKSSVKEYWDGDIPWITLVDLPAEDTITEITTTQRTISDEGLRKSAARMIPANSVVVSSRATIGRIGINRMPLCTNQGFKNVVIKDTDQAIPEYVAVALTKLVPEMEANASGSTYKEIIKSRFSRLSIPLPPLSEQQFIVDEIQAEREIVDANRRLIARMEARIRDVMGRVWSQS